MSATNNDRKTNPTKSRDLRFATTGQHDGTTRYVRNSKIISGRLHDELVMMDLDQGKYFSLNPVATRIWDLLLKPMKIDEVCSLLMYEYEIEAERCQAEVSELLEEMVKLGFVFRQGV
jgi:hypothetical protein